MCTISEPNIYIYIYIETEGTGGDVWQFYREENTASEDALLVYIREGGKGLEEERGSRSLILLELSILYLRGRAYITTKEKGLETYY